MEGATPHEGARVAAGNRFDDLSGLFEALANPTRLAILHRLASPTFVPELSRELRIARQAVRKHLEALEAAGLVHARPSRRGALPATRYATSPSGLFALKERVRGIAIHGEDVGSSGPTLQGGPAGIRPRTGAGLLLVHGDVPGRWLPLEGGPAWTLGRDPEADVALAYDPYASARHALLSRDATGWTVTDLHSRNGTHVDFQRLVPGRAQPVASGSVLTVGHSQLVLKTGG